nr:AsmA-like C-terminal region [uncultured bacterium]
MYLSEKTKSVDCFASGRELRFGRVRAVSPRIALVQFPDGTWNLPPGLTGPAGQGGGLQVRIGELVVQQGVFELDGRKMGVDARFDDFAVELFSLTRNRYRGTFACRKVTLALPSAEPIVFGVDLRYRLDPARGASVEALRATGEFGELRAAGSLENFKSPTVLLSASGEFHVAEVERLFHMQLGFQGDARFRGNLRIPPSGAFHVTGNVSSARVEAHGFAIEELEAAVTARPEALVASIDKARYAGGAATGSLRIENLAGSPGRPKPMTLTLDARGLSLERFFADIGLPGTGLSGVAALRAALRWAEGGIARASGGGTLAIEAGPPTSLVRGRYGIPTSGGGTLAIVDGRIGLSAMPVRFPASAIEVSGGLQIGKWMPDFDFHLRSRDLTEIDRLFQNFVAASGARPEALGLGGSGEVEGHLGGKWSNPDATAQFSAESARYAGVLFGSVRGSVDMRDGAFDFQPLRVYDGSATLSVEGVVRYRKDPARPTLDLTLIAKDYPMSRFLDYLDLEYPIEGRVTGSFPLSGSPPAAVSGGGIASLEDAVIWGQKVTSISGRLTLEPGRVEFDDVRADLGGGTVGGRAEMAYEKKTFQVRAAGDGVPLESLEAVRERSTEVTGLLSFELSGSGSLEDPDLTVSATLTRARFFGKEVAEELSPRLSVRVVRGDLDGTVSVPGRWSLAARGPLFGDRSRVDVALDVADLAALVALTPPEVPVGVGGALAAQGYLTMPQTDGQGISGEVTLTQARFDAEGHPGLLRTAGPARVRLQEGRVTLEELHATGEGIDLRLRGTLDTSPRVPDERVGAAVDDPLVVGHVDGDREEPPQGADRPGPQRHARQHQRQADGNRQPARPGKARLVTRRREGDHEPGHGARDHPGAGRVALVGPRARLEDDLADRPDRERREERDLGPRLVED